MMAQKNTASQKKKKRQNWKKCFVENIDRTGHLIQHSAYQLNDGKIEF